MVVGNGTPLTGVPDWVTRVPLEENLGCSGGRNAGLKLLLEPDDVDVVIDLDDDGLLVADDVFARVQQLYAAAPGLGIVSFRVADELGQTLRRHVPRLRAGDPLRRVLVTAFLGCGHALSAPMLRQRRLTCRGGRWTPGGTSCTSRIWSCSIPGRHPAGKRCITG